jgi:hypothetical protein
MRKITKRTTAIIAASVIAVGAAGAAWAAWIVTGTGTSSVTAGSSVALTVTGTEVTGALVPGSTSNVQFTVSNPNKFPVQINTITLDQFSGTTGCAASNITANSGATPPAASALLVPAATGSASGTLAVTYQDAIRMIANAEDGCQGATFGLHVSLGAASAA